MCTCVCNAKMILVKTTPGMGRGIKENGQGDKGEL
jgi:hypothetical protein